MKRSAKALLIVIIILLLQVTRNISLLGYIAILFSGYLYLYVQYGMEKKIGKWSIGYIELLFIISYITIPLNSIGRLNGSDFILSTCRYLITFPFIVFCLFYNNYSNKIIEAFLKIYTIFICIAALTIPYQALFGAISFFAESSERGGQERFASLAGSLTALGTLGAMGIVILICSKEKLFKSKTKNLMLICLIIGMLMSLQKAAIVNIIISIILIIGIKPVNLSMKKVSLAKVKKIITGCCIIVTLFFLMKDTLIMDYIESGLNYSLETSNLGVKEDFFKRLLEFPIGTMKYHNIGMGDLFMGIGLPALSGIVGLPELPMAHNNYFDLILSGGIIHLITFLIILGRVPIRVMMKCMKGKNITYLEKIYAINIILILINMTIGASSFYQPISCILIFFMASSYEKLVNLSHSDLFTQASVSKEKPCLEK